MSEFGSTAPAHDTAISASVASSADLPSKPRSADAMRMARGPIPHSPIAAPETRPSAICNVAAAATIAKSPLRNANLVKAPTLPVRRQGNSDFYQHFVVASGSRIYPLEEIRRRKPALAGFASKHHDGVHRLNYCRHFGCRVGMTEVAAQGAAVAHGSMRDPLIGFMHERACLGQERRACEHRVPTQCPDNELRRFDFAIIPGPESD